jgi:hypothetical protein
MTVLFFLQLLLAAMCVWASFCRLTKTDDSTYREVRWSILLQGAAAGLVFGAPFLPTLMPEAAHWRPWGTPRWIWLVFVGAVTIQQLVTMKHWLAAQPLIFRRPSPSSPAPAWHLPPRGMTYAVILMGVGLVTSVPHLVAAQSGIAAVPNQGGASVVAVGPGDSVRCTDAEGCVSFTIEALRGLLATAGGSCGRIPAARPL